MTRKRGGKRSDSTKPTKLRDEDNGNSLAGGMEEKEEKGKKGWRAEEIVFGNTRHGSVAGIKYARLYTSTSIV
jgi:hypothetical protein